MFKLLGGRTKKKIPCYYSKLYRTDCKEMQAEALMKEGGIIACEAPRHPFPAMHTAVRAGQLETAHRLAPLALRWGNKPGYTSS